MINSEKIKSLRDKTSISIMTCRKALEESGGDEVKAMEWLRKQGIEVAGKKTGRATRAGLVESYIHSDAKTGVLLELRSETDFVSKTPAFKEFGHNIAMHIAASNPADVKVLMEQPYIKNPDITVTDYLNDAIQKFGENIEITRFERFEI